MSFNQISMRERSVLCQGPHGLHRMAYVEWGDAANKRVVICVHGLTRNSRDFDHLAQALAGRYRVICPDVPGRGKSDWLPVKEDYSLPVYVGDMVTLIARLDVESVDWVGTSMGGLIGMGLASQAGNPIRRMILNDVGPVITAVSLKRLAEYVGKGPIFATFDEAVQYVRAVAAPFGPHTEEQWRHLTRHILREQDDGGLALHYDPGIAVPFRNALGDEDTTLWPVYDAIRCPTLVIRGAESDLLTRATAQEMARRGPKARTVEIPGVGHAPTLLDESQIGIVREFLFEA